jgi:arginase
MRLALITVPYTSSGLVTGEARAPDALRDAGLLDALRTSGTDVADYGDVAFAPPTPGRDPISGIIAPQALTGMVRAVRAAVSRARAEGRLPIVVGGECPLLLGCLAASRDACGRVGLLFVDGHEDAWPPHASTTGEAADMELGLALGEHHLDGVDELMAILPIVRPEDVVLLGPRDRADIEASGVPSLAGPVPLLADVEVKRDGARVLGRMGPERLQASTGNWWFHLDLDVLSSEALDAVRYPRRGDWTGATSIS